MTLTSLERAAAIPLPRHGYDPLAFAVGIAAAKKATHFSQIDADDLSDRICLTPGCERRLVSKSLWFILSTATQQIWLAANVHPLGGRGFCRTHYQHDRNRPVAVPAADLAYAINLANDRNVVPKREHGSPTQEFVEFDPPAWRESAVCASTDRELFFPATIRTSNLPKAMCGNCPVRDDCLMSAIRHREEHGVWGGYNPRELAYIYAALDPQDEPDMSNFHGLELAPPIPFTDLSSLDDLEAAA